MKHKLIRITTVPISLKVLLRRQLQFMSNYFDVLAVSSPDKTLDEVRESEGVRTYAVAMTRAITPLQDIKALWSLYRLFKKEKPSIVHSHTPKAGLLGMVAGKLAGVPLRLHTVAGLPLMESRGVKRKVLELVERITYSCATKVYPNSKNLASFIEQNNFCASKKLQVLGNGSSNGIDTSHFTSSNELVATSQQLRESLQIKESDFVFVFVGRLVKDKGIEELVEAFVQLKKVHAHIKLLLVGPFEPELDPIAATTQQAIEQDEDIIRVGFQQDVRPYLLLSQVLAFPSYREGFPNVPMQAGCFNIPSIVTNINGCNEIIEPGKNGLIIPAKNTKALQDAMDSLLTNPTIYTTLKANARRLIVERYDQKHFWSLLLNEYQEQLKSVTFVS